MKKIISFCNSIAIGGVLGLGFVFLFFILHPDYKVFIRPNFMQGKFQYCPKKFLDEICWGRALRELDRIKDDPGIIMAKMGMGDLISEGNILVENHAFIFYKTKDNREFYFDPMNGEREEITYYVD